MCFAMSCDNDRPNVTLPSFRELFSNYLPPKLSRSELSPSASSSRLGESSDPLRATSPVNSKRIGPDPRPISPNVPQPLSQHIPSSEPGGLSPIFPRNIVESGSRGRISPESNATRRPAAPRDVESPVDPPTKPPKRYACLQCGRAFTRPSSLRTHSYSHDGTRPYKCSFPGCLKAFSVKSNMKRHLSTHQKLPFHQPFIPPPPTLEPVSHWAQEWHSSANSFNCQPPSFVQGSSRDYPPSQAASLHVQSSARRDVLLPLSGSEEWSDATASNNASVAASIAECLPVEGIPVFYQNAPSTMRQ